MHVIEILSEAPRRPRMATPPPVDTSGFTNDITAVMRTFTAEPFVFRFKRTWADEVQKTVMARKAAQMTQHAHDAERGWDEPFQFDVAENLAEAADEVWRYGKNQLIQVRHNVEHAHDEYQQRAAERHNREDDPDFYIESSDYLRGMQAMVECARDLDRSRKLGNPHDVQAILAILKRFIAEWDQHDLPTDGGEAPILDGDFVEVIESLLPLLLLCYTKNSVGA